jgi:hypothetical protein
MKFGYEDLKVWNMAVDFAVKVIENDKGAYKFNFHEN